MGTLRTTITEVVESYVNGLGNRDLNNVPFAPDVTYESPISPLRRGQEVINFLTSLFPAIKGVQIKEHLVEGDYCATIFDLETLYGTIHIFDRFKVEGGQLKSINPYYDPAPLNEARTAERRGKLTAISESYFRGLAKRDLSAVPWDDNVVFRGPLAPGGSETPLVGRAAVLDWFASVYPVLGETRVMEHYFNEDLTVIATRADVGIINPPSVLRVVDRFTVNAEGKISQQENHYDPRPAIPSSS
jgi:hypothetical protein